MCEHARVDELRGLLARAGLSVHPLRGRQLRMFLVSSALGGSPSEFDPDKEIEVEVNRRDVRIGETASSDRCTWADGPGPWPPDSCKG